ncbi:cysteine peptidase family C39 domain-containing protein [Coraliomargarita sp. SDUM461003]|uniref:Cysteine peptidase family C39 domain-containing protein n=1 Tax=Thalassobacterium maritimum TaxID=3041265 RepID=A0ABU1AZ14_9BACT|nr:cysteine peptidase family C39 domain-containing protein [Coraliomargarita sp. SDUM461003]MDQ8209399.1 cysteine peptidase family C39 domain-containing protein [Coraliomargarita sp. SDUM461003]
MLQIEASECGVVCLAMILGFYKRWVPVETLRHDCGASRDGTNASNLLKAARHHGLDAGGFSLDTPEFDDVRLPAIIHWRFHHFVVLEKQRGGRYWINDPANGRYTVDAQTISEAFTGVLLTFRPGEQFETKGSQPSCLGSLRSYLNEVPKSLALTAGLALALVVPGLLLPFASIIFVDSILVQGFTDWLRPLLIGMGVVALLQFILTYYQQQMALVLATRLSVALGSRMIGRSLRLPLSFFAQRSPSEMASRAQLTDRLAGLISGPLAMSGIGLLTALLYMGVMLFFDPVLAAVIGLLGLANLLFFVWQFGRVQELNQALIRESTLYAGAQMQGLKMLSEVKASGMEKVLLGQLTGRKIREQNQQRLLVVRQTFMESLPTFLRFGAAAIVLYVGGLRVIDGGMSLGVLVAFQGLVMQFLLPIQQTLNHFTALQGTQGTLDRIEDIFRQDIESTPLAADTKAQPEHDPDACEHEHDERTPSSSVSAFEDRRPILRLENITFGYQPLAEPLLKDFNLEIAPGKWVALVGPSGSGKSTVARLLGRLHQPWSGEISLRGVALDALPSGEFNRRVALVDQDLVLFSGTVTENLTLWTGEMHLEQMSRATRAARIHDWIINQPLGFDHKIGEGGKNLSGGERARMDIARALAGEPDLIILDEATAALDALTEAELLRELRLHSSGGIIITHRLASIQDCDEIIVFSQGKPVQRGTHAELYGESRGRYRKLLEAEEAKPV